MADVLAGFLSGAKAGQAANAGRAKVAAAQAEKDRNFSVKVAAEARQVQGAREDQVARLDAFIDRADFGERDHIRALAMADSIDKAYGGTTATDNVKRTLNLGKRTGQLPAGDKGIKASFRPGTNPNLQVMNIGDVDHPNRGFKNATQKSTAQLAERSATTKMRMGAMRVQAMDMFEKTAFTNGELDPEKSVMSLIDIQTRLVANPNNDPAEVQSMIDDIQEDIGVANKAFADRNGEGEAFDKYVNTVSKTTDKLIDGLYKLSVGFDGNITEMMEGSAVPASKMKSVANRMALSGYNVPEIMQHIRYQFLNTDGTWPLGDDASNYDVAMAKMPPEHQVVLSGAYRSGYDPGLWVPVHDPLSQETNLVNMDTEKIVFMAGPPAQGPVSDGSENKPAVSLARIKEEAKKYTENSPRPQRGGGGAGGGGGGAGGDDEQFAYNKANVAAFGKGLKFLNDYVPPKIGFDKNGNPKGKK